ncbi:MAG: DUF2312 domain-containing protein, partial [Alphaproteobacteria bacterium]|nr:DUF2312 domain-containing protein [Alphaproteobacteria bacterium]
MDNETNTATAPNAEAEARSRLLYFVKRIEDLEMDKSGITKDIRDVFIEAKCAGYDT